MKKWYSYIILLLVCIGFASCQDNGTVPEPQTDGRVSVHLQIALPGGDPAERGAQARDENGGFDYTTSDQRTMTADDVFVLMFSSDDVLLKQATITGLSDETGDNSMGYYRTIDGVFDGVPNGSANVYFVVLANLVQNNLYDNEGMSLDMKSKVDTYISSFIGKGKNELYSALVYNYDGTSSPWNISNRRIPMWGATGKFDILSGQTKEVSCDLHRAVAKVAILVKEGSGIEGFEITKIEVKHTVNSGYCASLKTPVNGYYTEPSSPDFGALSYQNIVFGNDSYAFGNEFRNQIYLPEQDNSSNPIFIEVTYNYGSETDKVGTIKFLDVTTGEAFNVIRNHSYVFNIESVKRGEIEVKLYYVADSYESEDINIPVFK